MRWALATVGFAVAAVAVWAAGLLGFAAQELRYVELARPWGLAGLLLPLLAVVARGLAGARPGALALARTGVLARLGAGPAARLVALPDGLRLAAGLLLALALARPQSSRLTDKITHEGIDIVIALDMSESMEASDLPPSRLEAAKAVIDGMIQRRPHDRIGLVVFGSHASTVSPLTMDHDVLRALLRRLRLGVVEGSRTAIGAGLGVALNRLEESEAESKVVVLLTDGVHNAEGLDPDTAAQAAADRDVRVYTILMGRHDGDVGTVDPARLERIASVTGGYAYTAEDLEALRTTFQDLLDKLERSTIEGERVRAELFPWLLWPALLLLLLDGVLRNTWLRRFP